MKHCKICGVTASDSQTGRLVRDHNHRTGFVRGKLCDPCNGRVGAVECHRRKNKPLKGHLKKWYQRYKHQINEQISRVTKEYYGPPDVKLGQHFGGLSSVFCKECQLLIKVRQVDRRTGFYLQCGHTRPLSY